jgi:hypothetical protein
MTFIIEAVKDDHYTTEIRSSAIVAGILARKLALQFRSGLDRTFVFRRSLQPFADG